jgi:uncharacterized protein YbjQ (UPF0145 family)
MILSTTPTIEGRAICRYLGVVSGDIVLGANVIRDLAAAFTDFFGGRSNSYEKVFADGREIALAELQKQAELLGANAVVGIDFDYEVLGAKGSMMLISATGTAVVIE